MSRGFTPGGSSRSMADLQVSVKLVSERSSIAAMPVLVCGNSEQQQQQQQQHPPQQQLQQLQKLDVSKHREAMKFGMQALWPAMEDVMEELMFEDRTLEAERASDREDEPLRLGDSLRQTLGGLKLRVKVGNASLRRLLSGAFAGAVSRTAVAPLETIRTHLMVGSAGSSVTEVFNHIMQTEGWQGLFRGNGINVIRVTPSKAIELFAYDTVKNALTPKEGETPLRIPLPLPVSTIAGAAAGVCSTLCTYPLELLKTRLTVQKGVYDNLFHALVKIVREEGPLELYRGLVPSVIGIIPYCGINYFAYESLKKAYRKMKKEDNIGHLATLLIGSTAGVISSSATYPLEVARKQMQMGALNVQVYEHLFQALQGIIEKEGAAGLYRGLGASCLKLVPAAGISFMCYEACKKVLAEDAAAVAAVAAAAAAAAAAPPAPAPS